MSAPVTTSRGACVVLPPPMEWWACASTLHIGPSHCAMVLAGRAVTLVKRVVSMATVAPKVDWNLCMISASMKV